MRTLLAAAVLGAAFATTASAQPSNSDMSATMQRAQAAQAAAQAQASQPGDEALTCDQLQYQLTASMSNPSMGANLASLGAQAQTASDQARQQQQEMAQQAAPNVAASVVTSLIPGAGLFHHAPQQSGSSQAQINEAQRQSAQLTNTTNAMMPEMMRGQRLYQMAQAKQCAFLRDPSAAPVPHMSQH
jgi:hypothetical protein